MSENRATAHANVRTTSTTDATRAAGVTSATSAAGTDKGEQAAGEMIRESGKPKEGQSMTMSMKGNGMSDGDKDGELRRIGRHGRTRCTGLLGVVGRIAESEQVAGLDHPARFRKPGKFWMKLVGVLTAAALGLTSAGSALADDFTAPDTSSSTDSSVSSNSDTWAGQADGTLDTAPGDASDNAGTNDGSASTDTSNTQSDATTQPAVTSAEDCTHVQDWDTLAHCVSTQTGVVTITKTIDVPAGDAVKVNTGNVILTAATGDKPALTTTATKGNLDAFFVVNEGATLTIGQSTDDAGFSYKNGNRWLAYVNAGGSLVVNNGTFDNIDTATNPNGKRNQGTLAYNVGGTITINGGTFTNNKAGEGGVIYNSAGSVTVNAGKFSGNTAVNGGVLFQTGKETASLSITGGTFDGNKSVDSGDNAGGGVLFQNWGATTITGGTFTNNAQTYSAACTNDNPSACRHMRSGGGAIHTEAGSLTIAGNVKFSGNHSKAYGWGDGGGAVYAQGTLWIRNDAWGNRPSFDGNWSGIYDTQYIGEGQVPNGGAGGAIFLQDNSTAYLMGGSFTKNSSGYLGGAIYTEENSTTYIAKAATYENIAGHFGGGLWLCPSGSGEASKGGNIALFDNGVDKSIDPNTGNQSPANLTGADGTEAGDDFAIMNPYHKKHGDTSFMLMDTWFTDRTESAVTWYHDGIPVQNASGYDDSYQNPQKQDWAGVGGVGSNLAVTKSDGRYVDGSENAKIEDKDYSDHVKNLKLGWGKTTAEFHDRGVALKAIVKGKTPKEQESRKSAAKSAAAVEISGNKARLSGGGFGTNGNVLFSTPYTASWSKVDSEDTSKELSGSQWDLSATTSGSFTGTGTTEGEAIKSAIKQFNEKNENTPVAGPFNVDFSPTLCPVTTDSADKSKKFYEEGYADGHCWKQTFGEYKATETEESNVWTVTFTSITLSAVITDNSSNDKGGTAYTGAFDNNPDGGGFDLNNLAPGTYTLKERTAPTGYELNTNTYQFKIVNGPAKWQKLDSDGKPSGDFTQTDIAIPDKALPGVSWSKTDVDTGALLSDSEWTVTKYQQDGETLETKSRWIVQDCVHLTDKDIDCSTQAKNSGEYLGDHDNAAGKFNITGLQPGKYRLTESVAPEGYWDPQEDVYEFTIKDADTSVQLTKVGGGTTDETVTAITNKLPQISWKKVDKTSLDIITDSETKTEWTVTGPVAVLVDGDASTDTSELDLQSETVSVTDCQSKDDADASVRCSTQKTGKQQGESGGYYNDLDNAVGQLKISGLLRPTADQAAKNIRYQYVLKETKAPAGYMKSDKEYVFTIGATEAQSSLKLDDAACSDTVGGTNCIPNAKSVASLPLTGGDARSWMFIGTGLALMAALAALATGWVKRRELW